MRLTNEQIRDFQYSSIDEIEALKDEIDSILKIRKEFFRLAIKAVEIEFSTIHTNYYTGNPSEIVFLHTPELFDEITYHFRAYLNRDMNKIVYERDTEDENKPDENWKEETISKATFIKFMKREQEDQASYSS